MDQGRPASRRFYIRNNIFYTICERFRPTQVFYQSQYRNTWDQPYNPIFVFKPILWSPMKIQFFRLIVSLFPCFLHRRCLWTDEKMSHSSSSSIAGLNIFAKTANYNFLASLQWTNSPKMCNRWIRLSASDSQRTCAIHMAILCLT